MLYTRPILAVVGTVLMLATAQAQTAGTTTDTGTAPGTTAPAVGVTGTTGAGADTAGAATSAAPAVSAPPTGADANQAVRSQPEQAAQPAHGANSFTRTQATNRLRRHGYASVAGMKKDTTGVWRGTASKDGAPVQVWVDYKGNVGQD